MAGEEGEVGVEVDGDVVHGEGDLAEAHGHELDLALVVGHVTRGVDPREVGAHGAVDVDRPPAQRQAYQGWMYGL